MMGGGRLIPEKVWEAVLICPGSGNGSRGWGLSPPPPTSEECRRPRRGAPVADRLPEIGIRVT